MLAAGATAAGVSGSATVNIWHLKAVEKDLPFAKDGCADGGWGAVDVPWKVKD